MNTALQAPIESAEEGASCATNGVMDFARLDGAREER